MNPLERLAEILSAIHDYRAREITAAQFVSRYPEIVARMNSVPGMERETELYRLLAERQAEYILWRDAHAQRTS